MAVKGLSIHPHREWHTAGVGTHEAATDAALVSILVAVPAVTERALIDQNEILVRCGVGNVLAGEGLAIFATHDVATKLRKSDRNTVAAQTIFKITADHWRIRRE